MLSALLHFLGCVVTAPLKGLNKKNNAAERPGACIRRESVIFFQS